MKNIISSKLQRTVGIPGLLAYYVSSVVGVGILVIPAIAAQIAGPASLLSWLALSLLSYPFALLFAQMSIMYPDSSGIAMFVEKAFGVRLGKTVAVLLMCTMIVGNPVMGIATARYLQNILGFPDGWPLLLVSCGMMLFSVLFNLLGLKFGSKIQTLVLLLLIIGLLGIILFAIPHARVEYLIPFAPHGWPSVGFSAVICFFSFLGWENVSSIAEEVINPQRTFNFVISWAVVIVGLLYISIASIFIMVIPPQELQGKFTVISALLQVVSGERAAYIGSMIAVILLILSTNAWILGASRLMYSLARDSVLPNKLAYISRTTGVPANALYTLAICYTLVLLVLFLSHSDERSLINFANSNFLIVYLCASLAGIKLFRTRDIRILTLVALVATGVFLPFFRIGLLYSAAIFSLAYFLPFISKKK